MAATRRHTVVQRDQPRISSLEKPVSESHLAATDPDTHPREPAISQAGTPGPVAISVAQASKTYANGLQALRPIDLQVRVGEFATLLGPSGCGKSTLLRMIAGLSAPTTGTVALHATHGGTTESSAAGKPATPPRAAFVFQMPTLMPWTSVTRNVRLPLELQGIDAAVADRQVAAALELVRLQDFAALYPRELSGGMQMRTSIARALVTEPDLLLMDEPFGALDEITRSRLDLEIRELWARRSLTVLFVTHSIYEAVFLSTRVLVMSARPGRIVDEIVIDEPHPRVDSFRVSERFAKWCKLLADRLAIASGDLAS